MKEQILKRSVSCVLTLCMLFLMLPIFSLDVTAVGGEDVFQLEADCQVLKFVDEEVFNAADHVARLPEEETLSSYAFLNRDGTKTVYFLNENAKYYDATGAVKEKNIDLVAGLNAYTVTQNDVQLSIPADPASGIGMAYAGYDISLVPQGGSSTMVQHTDNSVGYINYYGKGTALLYTPTYSGIKEDILLAAYTGISSFTFLLNTDGLRLYSQNGRYFLAASADSDMQIRLGDVVAYDAQCNMSRGTLTATAITEGQQYLLAVSVDESFLTDESTVYPVVIDPTMTISNLTYGNPSLQDATLFSGSPNNNFGSDVYNWAGLRDNTHGIGRTAICTGGLANHPIYKKLAEEDVLSATFHIKDFSGSGASTVNLYALYDPWTESSVTWNNIGSYWPYIYASASVGGNAMASFDITDLVKDWISGVMDIQSGFILINANENVAGRQMFSSEHTTTANRPYIALNYQMPSYSISINQNASFAINTSSFISETITGWVSNDPDIATVSSAGLITGVKAGVTIVNAILSTGEQVPFTVYVTIPNGIYYLKNAGSVNYLGTAYNTAGILTPQLQSKTTTDPNRLRQLWRIDYVKNGYYTIRPLYMMDYCLSYDSSTGGVSLRAVGDVYEVSDVTSDVKWNIYFHNGGYVFQHYDHSSHTMYPAGSGTAAGTSITTGTYAGSNSTFRWTLENGGSPMGALLHDTANGTLATTSTVKYVESGQTVSPTQLKLYASYYADGEYCFEPNWLSTNPNVASVNIYTGQVTAHAPGTATITLSMMEDYSGEEFICRYTITVVRSLNLNVYYSDTYERVFANEDISAAERISPQIEKAQEFFLDNFNINLTYSTLQNEVSYGDHCRTFANNNYLCECGRKQQYYSSFEAIPDTAADVLKNNIVDPTEPWGETVICHTCYYHQLYEIIPENPATTASVFYLGTQACLGTSADDHNPINGLWGICITEYNVVGIFNPHGAMIPSTDGPLKKETTTTVHELGHLFGAIDHYGDLPNSGNIFSTQDLINLNTGYAFSKNCMYGEYKDTLLDPLTVCEGCRAVINGKLVLPVNNEQEGA